MEGVTDRVENCHGNHLAWEGGRLVAHIPHHKMMYKWEREIVVELPEVSSCRHDSCTIALFCVPVQPK